MKKFWIATGVALLAIIACLVFFPAMERLVFNPLFVLDGIAVVLLVSMAAKMVR